MFPPPTGREPSLEQVRELDDAFFGSDPHGYFLARVRSLIAYADGAEADYAKGLAAEFRSKLRWIGDTDFLAHTSDALQTQVAVDAMSLRQHVAEAVARLWLALMQTRTAEPGSVSVWATLSKTPMSNLQVFDKIRECDEWNDGQAHLDLLLPKDRHIEFRENELVRQGVDVVHQWLDRTVDLLTRSDINIAAANNKYKHGFAVRARLDERIAFFSAGASPST